MVIACDTHLHSNHSHDSLSSLRDVCESAIAKGLKIVSTSEHVFLDPRDVGFGYFQLESYLEEVKVCAEVYSGKLKVLSGIEFSEPNLYPRQFEALRKQPIDTIVGSLHWLQKGFFGDPKVVGSMAPKALLACYYEDLLKVVNYGGFDSLAHMDLIKRYIKVDETQVDTSMRAVLEVMVKKDIALEMNTSTIRRDNQEPAASFALVRTYLAMGGQCLTIGSDAHCLEDIGADFDMIPKSFYPYLGYFEKHKFKKMDL